MIGVTKCVYGIGHQQLIYLFIDAQQEHVGHTMAHLLLPILMLSLLESRM